MSRGAVLLVAAVSAMSVLMSAQERDRAKVAPAFTWNLTDVYTGDDAWRTRKEAVAAEIPALNKYQGQLGTSAATLADALERMSQLDKELSRLYVYASMRSDEDTRVSITQGMEQEMQQLYATFGAQASF